MFLQLKKGIGQILLLVLLLLTIYALYSRNANLSKERDRWESNFITANTDNAIQKARINKMGDSIYELKQYTFSVDDLKSKNLSLSNEVKKAKQIADEFEVKYKNLISIYHLMITATGHVTDTFTQIIYVPGTTTIDHFEWETANDMIQQKCFYFGGSDSFYCDYIITPEIEGVVYLYRDCPDSGIGSFACNKTFLKVFWKNNNTRTEFKCKQDNCYIRNGFDVKVIKK